MRINLTHKSTGKVDVIDSIFELFIWLLVGIIEKHRPARFGLAGLMAGLATFVGYSFFSAWLSHQFLWDIQQTQLPLVLCSIPASFFGLFGGVVGGHIGKQKFPSVRLNKYVFAGIGGMITSGVIILLFLLALY
jgi:hypothetical protein